MTQYASKGTLIKQTISASLTTIAQVFSIKAPKATVETYDGTTLDQSGVGKANKLTGYVDGGEVTFEGFLDPALAGHVLLTTNIKTPALIAYSIVWSDVAPTSWLFTGSLSLEAQAALGDGLKFTATIKLDGIATYP